jgi:hypothetical protein
VSDELDLGISVPEPPPKKEKGGATWVGYHPRKPVHCDVCLAEVHARWPNDTHAPNVASYRRKEKGVDTYWCSVHAEPKKAADNQEKKR